MFDQIELLLFARFWPVELVALAPAADVVGDNLDFAAFVNHVAEEIALDDEVRQILASLDAKEMQMAVVAE